MKHTPGPWKADMHHIGDGWRVFVQHKAESDQHDAICDLETWQKDRETQANARLIAASPALLEACEMALRVLLQTGNGEDYVDRTINDLEAALSAAKGE